VCQDHHQDFEHGRVTDLTLANGGCLKIERCDAFAI
jgi:hypothetical protein